MSVVKTAKADTCAARRHEGGIQHTLAQEAERSLSNFLTGLHDIEITRARVLASALGDEPIPGYNKK